VALSDASANLFSDAVAALTPADSESSKVALTTKSAMTLTPVERGIEGVL
jgi:hypothetical protein